MKFSDNITEISKALAQAQADMKNPCNTANNLFYKSKYAPLSDVLNTTRPVLAKHGISIVQNPITDNKSVGVETLILHTSGQYILCEPYYVTPPKNDPQSIGGAITYVRRYALNAVLGINGEEDDDGNNSTATQPQIEPQDIEEITESYMCPVCGEEVKGVRKDDRNIPAYDVLQNLGMCYSCYRKERENHVE